MSNYRVLSIQSHVVHGYVGNKAAVFPLQVIFRIIIYKMLIMIIEFNCSMVCLIAAWLRG
jgi:hypothetical protein